MPLMTRREFGLAALAGVSASVGVSARSFSLGPQAASANRSLIGGVQFGLQPFCYHDLAMTPANRGELVRRLVQNGLGMVELHATWVEPRLTAPGVTAAEAREKLRAWRLSNPREHYQAIRREFDAAGIQIFSYYVNMNDSYTDAEIDATFE